MFTVKSYEMIYSRSIQELRRVFQDNDAISLVSADSQLKLVDNGMIVWKSLKPEPGGSIQKVGIKIKRNPFEVEANYYVVVRGVGTSGIKGPASNVLTVRFKTSPPTTPNEEVTEPTEANEMFNTEPDVENEDDLSQDYLIADDSVGALGANRFILIFIVVLAFSIIHLLF